MIWEPDSDSPDKRISTQLAPWVECRSQWIDATSRRGRARAGESSANPLGKRRFTSTGGLSLASKTAAGPQRVGSLKSSAETHPLNVTVGAVSPKEGWFC